MESSTASIDRASATLWAFESRLGWMGILWSGCEIIRNAFGHQDLGELQRQFAREAADNSLPATDPIVKTGTPKSRELQALIRGFKSYGLGKVVDFEEYPISSDHLTEFQQRVIECCRCIKYGETVSYGDLAQTAGFPRAARAVGSVMRSNRHPLLVPCHRVVSSSGLGGYSAADGLDTKRRLLTLEGVI
jgi:methylated-DNA-[protein]-cysteine S-methyltransferase